MRKYNTFFLAKSLVLFGLSFWLTVAVINNITDFGTNNYLLREMLSMNALKADPLLGKGLEWRNIIQPVFSQYLLIIIIAIEIFIALLLWNAAFSWLKISKLFYANKKDTLASVVSKTNIALICFAGLWFFFWIGGLWFGYWLKMPQVQQVHMMLIILSVGIIAFINLDSKGECNEKHI